LIKRAKVKVDGDSPMGVKQIAALCIVLFVLSACMIACRRGGASRPELLARVGDVPVSRVDVSYRKAIEKAYGNEAATDAGALVALVNDALEHEVGAMYGVAATPDELAALAKHADETSKAPEILATVKRTFGDDKPAYERLFLAPKIVGRKLRIWYSRNAEIHQRERTSIEKAYSLIHSGRSLEQAAQACGLNSSSRKYGETQGEVPVSLKHYFPQDGELSQDPMLGIVETMSKGETYKNIVDDGHSYRVIKLVQRDGTRCELKAVAATKRPFGEWFQRQATQVSVNIVDAELEKKLSSEYPNVSWVKKSLNSENTR
jgi:hypothetical protein